MFRIEGELHPAPGFAAYTAADTEQLLNELLPDELLAIFQAKRQVDFSFTWKEQARFRGNAYIQRGTVSVALRSISYAIPSVEDLFLPPVMAHFCNQKQGLIVITGPTGSGKSTTQAALIGHINASQRRHILTLEDPIEFVHDNRRSIVSQREVGADTPTFQDGLRAALREDPDIVLVGEMRDPESISTTLTVAETGHLVFATLHTNDTSSALDRIIDVFPSGRQDQIRTQLSASLTAVVAQRLVPRVGGGLIAAFEILLANSAIRSLIRDGSSHMTRNVISQSVGEGMQTLEQSLSVLLAHGYITYEDAVRVAVVPKEIRAYVPQVPAAPQPVS